MSIDEYSDLVAPEKIGAGDDIWDFDMGEGMVVVKVGSGRIQIGRAGADGAIQPAKEGVETGYYFYGEGTRQLAFSQDSQVRRRPR